MQPASHVWSSPSRMTSRSRATAASAKPTSRRNGPRWTANGWISAMQPTTTVTMKRAAPRSSPIASEPESDVKAAYVAKTSGEPLPNARSVTPAVLSDMPSWAASDDRLGTR